MRLRISVGFWYVLLMTVVSKINGNHNLHEMSNYRSQRTPPIPRNTRFDKPIAEILVGQRAFVIGNNRRDGGILLDETRGEEDHLFKDPGNSNPRNKYIRQNRAIESTVQNVIDRDFIRGNSKDYSNPSNGFVPYPQEEDRFPSASFQIEESANWNSGFEDQKDYFDESEDERVNLEEFLDELSRQRVHGELENLRTGTRSRQGRRRKLTSQEQGILLVEALRKKRNSTYINDHRGHGSDIQSGIMDMLGKSTCREFLLAKFNIYPVFFVDLNL